MYVITAHQRYRQTDGRTSSDPMTATLLKHVAVIKTLEKRKNAFLYKNNANTFVNLCSSDSSEIEAPA